MNCPPLRKSTERRCLAQAATASLADTGPGTTSRTYGASNASLSHSALPLIFNRIT